METVYYTVRDGNTLFGIAQFFGTTVDKIMMMNRLDDPNNLFPGQTLVIPAGTENATGFVYIVRPGDTLWSIAQRYGTTVDNLLRKNAISNPNIIYPGLKLNI